MPVYNVVASLSVQLNASQLAAFIEAVIAAIPAGVPLESVTLTVTPVASVASAPAEA